MTSNSSTDSAVHQGQSQSEVSNSLAPPLFNFSVRRKRTKSRICRFVCCLTGGGLSSSNKDKVNNKVQRFNNPAQCTEMSQIWQPSNHTVNPHGSTKISRNTRELKLQLINITRSRRKLFAILCVNVLYFWRSMMTGGQCIYFNWLKLHMTIARATGFNLGAVVPIGQKEAVCCERFSSWTFW